MFDRWMKYSYAAQKKERHRLLRIVFFIVALFLLYNSVNAFLVSVWVIQNEGMRPGIRSGDRLLLLSLTLPSLLDDVRKDGGALSIKRGNIVLIDMGRAEQEKSFLIFADAVVRFFTAQHLGVLQSGERLFLKRVIALPGDEISMTNFVLRVKPAGGNYTLTEFELSDKPYQPVIPHVPALWDESLPFSGNMAPVVLGTDECFLVSDDRGNTSDSRTWGPVSSDLIIGKAVFRFWPPARIGRP